MVFTVIDPALGWDGWMLAKMQARTIYMQNKMHGHLHITKKASSIKDFFHFLAGLKDSVDTNPSLNIHVGYKLSASHRFIHVIKQHIYIPVAAGKGTPATL